MQASALQGPHYVARYQKMSARIPLNLALLLRNLDTMRTPLLLLALLAFLASGTGCDSKDWQAAGYQDGYAATVNTACKFRTSLVHGKFDDPAYAKGYSLGSQAGAAAVAQQGCEKLR